MAKNIIEEYNLGKLEVEVSAPKTCFRLSFFAEAI